MGENNQKWHSAFAHLSKIPNTKEATEEGSCQQRRRRQRQRSRQRSTLLQATKQFSSARSAHGSTERERGRERDRDTLLHSLIFITNVRFLELSSVVAALLQRHKLRARRVCHARFNLPHAKAQAEASVELRLKLKLKLKLLVTRQAAGSAHYSTKCGTPRTGKGKRRLHNFHASAAAAAAANFTFGQLEASRNP